MAFLWREMMGYRCHGRGRPRHKEMMCHGCHGRGRPRHKKDVRDLKSVRDKKEIASPCRFQRNAQKEHKYIKSLFLTHKKTSQI